MAYPSWMDREIAKGLTKLIPLSMDYAPPADVLRGTVMAWVDALNFRGRWDEQLDAWRFEQAFRWIGANMTTWPKPRQFIDALPQRKPQLTLSAPPEPLSPEALATLEHDRARAQQCIDDLAAKLGVKL